MKSLATFPASIACFLVGAAYAADDAPPAGVRLVDVADEAGVGLVNVAGERVKDYIVEVNGNGAAFFDYDGDGHLDILIVNGSTLQRYRTEGGDPMLALYRNDGRGRFADVTGDSGLDARGWGMGACVADIDNDGDEDVYVTAFGANVMYRNENDGTFANITAETGLGDSRWGTNCAFGDYDRDGDVDLYVANFLTFDENVIPRRGVAENCRYMGVDVICGPRGLPGEADALYRNDGDGTFTDVTEQAGIDDPGYYGFGALFSDLDMDGWPDIFVANDSTPNLLFHNQGDGFFSDATFRAGLGESSLPYLGWGTGFVDIDNNGLLDLFIANGHVYPGAEELGRGSKFRQRKQLYRNLGDGTFREITGETGGGLLIEKSSRGSAIGDYDNDGDLDVLVINLDERPTLLRNDTRNDNHWVSLRLVGTDSNRSAIGASVKIVAGGRQQLAEVRSGGSYLSHNDMRLHFGLGEADEIDILEIRWPSGLEQRFEGVAADRFLVIMEGGQPQLSRVPANAGEGPAKSRQRQTTLPR